MSSKPFMGRAMMSAEAAPVGFFFFYFSLFFFYSASENPDDTHHPLDSK